MNFFEEALASSRSTILHGSFGRYPHLVKFYLNSIPELIPFSSDEPIFWYYPKARFLHIMVEPPFHAVIPSGKWILVLTSHVRLQWNPLTTRVVECNRLSEIPRPQSVCADHKVLIPPTSHELSPFVVEPTRVDLSSVETTHEAYLRLLTFFDLIKSTTRWSLSIPEKIRQGLLRDVSDTRILKALD